MQLDWIPIYTSILDSTLWEEPPHVRLMFFTLMFIKDPADYIVREPVRRLAKIANLGGNAAENYDLAQDALRILSAPDKRSPENQKFEGRRIRWLEEQQGWLILNGEYYEKLRRELAARIRKTQKQRERRLESKKRAGSSEPLAGESAALRPGAPADAAERIGAELDANREERSRLKAQAERVRSEAEARAEEAALAADAPEVEAEAEGPPDNGEDGGDEELYRQSPD